MDCKLDTADCNTAVFHVCVPPRNMIKSFYTSSLLLDVLSVFGEMSEEVRRMGVRSRTFHLAVWVFGSPPGVWNRVV